MDTCSTAARTHLVIVGHVDHGKSTLVGRLLTDTGSLPEGKLDAIRLRCEQTGKQFEYAFLLDALKDEQSQGITVEAARVFFNSPKRQYIIIDAPGHIEFLRNMVTGAAHAEAAVLVLDAEEGIKENSKRHGYVLSMLGIKNVIIAVNKMDLVGYDQNRFDSLCREYTNFLSKLNLSALHFIPISAYQGENIAAKGKAMPWYKGTYLLDALDSLPVNTDSSGDELRYFVQDVYKFTKFGDSRRIVAGTIDAGNLKVGDELVFYPAGKKSVVKSLEFFPESDRASAEAGEAVGFTLREQIYAARGDLVTKYSSKRPQISSRLNANVFWLGKSPLTQDKEYTLCLGTARVRAKVEKISRVLDVTSLKVLESNSVADANNAAECTFKLSRPIAFDLVDTFPSSARFVLIEQHQISGGGIVTQSLEDDHAALRDRLITRNSKWEHSLISSTARAERFNQRPTLVLITGERKTDRKSIAKALEAKLFNEGRLVYFLGIGNILHGLDADIDGKENIDGEHIRRLAEVSNLMLDTGLILLVTAAELEEKNLHTIKEIISDGTVKCVWVGKNGKNNLNCDLQLEDNDIPAAVHQIEALLREEGILG